MSNSDFQLARLFTLALHILAIRNILIRGITSTSDVWFVLNLLLPLISMSLQATTKHSRNSATPTVFILLCVPISPPRLAPPVQQSLRHRQYQTRIRILQARIRHSRTLLQSTQLFALVSSLSFCLAASALTTKRPQSPRPLSRPPLQPLPAFHSHVPSVPEPAVPTLRFYLNSPHLLRRPLSPRNA